VDLAGLGFGLVGLVGRVRQVRLANFPLTHFQLIRPMLAPTAEEMARQALVLQAVIQHIKENQIIRMNAPEFSGSVGIYTYFFEGEDDLLHIGVLKKEKGLLSVEEAQCVLSFLAPGLSAGVVWVKPGTVSHHFYFAHDELL